MERVVVESVTLETEKFFPNINVTLFYAYPCNTAKGKRESINKSSS